MPLPHSLCPPPQSATRMKRINLARARFSFALFFKRTLWCKWTGNPSQGTLLLRLLVPNTQKDWKAGDAVFREALVAKGDSAVQRRGIAP